MKKCNRCKVIKSEDQFIIGKNKCLQCYNWCHGYYKENREHEIERAKKNANKDRPHTNSVKRQWSRKNPISNILCRIKSKAKKYNIPFNLTHEDIIIPEICPVLGIKLNMSEKTASGCSPSVDRIIPSVGYVKGNIQIISHRANSIKNDATSKELEKVLEYVKKNEKNC